MDTYLFQQLFGPPENTEQFGSPVDGSPKTEFLVHITAPVPPSLILTYLPSSSNYPPSLSPIIFCCLTFPLNAVLSATTRKCLSELWK